jgi:hypothetical protein
MIIVELGSGTDVEKPNGGIGSPVACTCGRTASAMVVLLISYGFGIEPPCAHTESALSTIIVELLLMMNECGL